MPMATGRPKWAINSGRWVDVPLETKVIRAIKAA
jgi:hypothetical protein